jgi:hypothetical protein
LADASAAVSGVGSDDDTSRRLDARDHDADLEELVQQPDARRNCMAVLDAGAATDARL